MLKVFINSLVLLALQGCLSTDTAPRDTSTEQRAEAVRPHVPIGPPPDVRSSNARLFDQAIAAIAAEAYVKAEVLLLEITDDQPELAGPWINLGQVYEALGQQIGRASCRERV